MIPSDEIFREFNEKIEKDGTAVDIAYNKGFSTGMLFAKDQKQESAVQMKSQDEIIKIYDASVKLQEMKLRKVFFDGFFKGIILVLFLILFYLYLSKAMP